MKGSKNAELATKRYNLVIPEPLYDEVSNIADKHHTTVVDVIKKFIKLGLLVEASPERFVIKGEDNVEKQVMIL